MVQSQEKDFLQVPEISVEVFPVGIEGENWIAHQLPGPMVGNVPSPPHLEELNPQSRSFVFGEKDVVPSGGSPYGDDVGVFYKEELVWYLPVPPSGYQLCLKLQSLTVGDPTELSNFDGGEPLLRHPPGNPL